MSACRCHQAAGYCQCLVEDSDCVVVERTDPYRLGFRIDPAPDNIVSGGSQGLRALMPRSLSNPPSTAVFREDMPSLLVQGNTQVAIPFDVALWDLYGNFDTQSNARSIHFSEPGLYMCHGAVAFNRTEDSGRSFWSYVWLQNNPVTTFWFQVTSHPSNPGREMRQNVGGLVLVEAGAFIEMRVLVLIESVRVGSGEPMRGSLSMTRLGSA